MSACSGEEGADPASVAVRRQALTFSAVDQIDTGTFNTCARLASGEARCWGDDNFGQLGDDAALADKKVPVPVQGAVSTSWIAYSHGGLHACYADLNGNVRCWGINSFAQLGNGTNVPSQSPTPVPVSGVTGVVEVANGNQHVCALHSTGTVTCWGGTGSESGLHRGIRGLPGKCEHF